MAPPRLDPANYGVVADANPSTNAQGIVTLSPGATDNTTPLNNYLAACQAAGEEWFIPKGKYKVGGDLIIQCGGSCEGTLFVPNTTANPKIKISSLAEDISSISIDTIRQWSGLTRRSRKIDGLSNMIGRYISLDIGPADSGNVKLINRMGEPDDFRLGEGFLVSDNEGRLAHALYADWNVALWPNNTKGAAKVKICRDSIRIVGLDVVIYDDGGNQKTNLVLGVERPNTDLDTCSIINRSGRPIGEGFSVIEACNVNHYSCFVSGIQFVSPGYGFNSGLSAGLSYVNCSEVHCRRGIDAHRSKNIQIIGGNLPDGWGCHYAWWMGSTGTTIGISSASNPHAVHVAGGGFWVTNCQVSLNNVTASNGEVVGYSVLRVRDDVYECGDTVVVQGNSITVPDNTGTNPQANAVIVNLSGDSAGYDTGRKVEMPRLITIRDNAIDVRGSTRCVSAIGAFKQSWSGSVVKQQIECSARWEIENNAVFYGGGSEFRTDDSTMPRFQIYYGKPTMLVGSGVDLSVRGGPATLIQVVAVQSISNTANTRVRGRIGEVSHARVNWGPGAHEQIVVDAPGLFVDRLNATSGWNVVGDEVVSQHDQQRLSIRPGISNNAAVSTILTASGSEPNLDLVLSSKGTGVVCFGSRTGTGDRSINGYVTIKDTSGNTVRLATVA